MKTLVQLNPDQQAAFEAMMKEDMQTSRSAFFGFLVVQEWKRRQTEKTKRAPGRPKGNSTGQDGSEADDDFPDENAPRTKTLPKHLEEYVIMPLRKNLVNDYDILMLEEKQRMHKENAG